MQLRALFLGAAAGGGLPQWNCGCVNCSRARRGKIPSLAQSSLAVLSDGEHWVVQNASPDIRTQVAACPPLHPTGPRISLIASVPVTNGDIDHVAGLLTMRERQTFTLYGTAEIRDLIGANAIFDALAPGSVTRRAVALKTPFDLAPGVSATLFPVPGKIPLYMEGEEVLTDLGGEQMVGVEVPVDGATAFCIPGCARVTQRLADRLRGAELVFFDGAVWHDDELIRAGVGHKIGARMGHMAMSGPMGTIAAFASLGVAHKVFVHINNTNPALDPASPERAEAEAAGWTIGEDGMEIQA